MPNPNPSLKGFQRYKAKKAAVKAYRLAKRLPKSREEKLMNKEQYEAYIDKFLELEDSDETPSMDQTKIAEKMYGHKSKEQQVLNPLDADD